MFEMFSTDQLKEYNDTISYLKNLVTDAINNYVIEKNLESLDDITKYSQGKWYAVLMYIATSCMIPNNVLLKADKAYIYSLGLKGNKYYNLYIIDGLYNIYSYLCNDYDKGITPYGYSLFLGIDYQVLSDALTDNGGNEGKLSNTRSEIFKKIYTAYEQSAEAKLWSNKNPVAIMAINNRRFGWNMPGVGRDSSGRSALGAAELPQLDQKP